MPATDNDVLDPIEESPALFPSTITRVETALSKFPVHNLSKTESIAIHIYRKGQAGEADVHWTVSTSREYGEPRQLAYKVDTLIVNRKIDEASRPIPRILRLGSFRDLCQQLDLSPSGDNFSGLRLALLQNASAFITAKLTYRAADGSTKKLEAGFSRYSVVFTGDEMPNGYRADAVHILLNEQYWKLLNKAQFRPLDYDYQKSLKPAAHRFYELVSFPMYGCLSRGHIQAKLLYSDYCLRAPQQRYFDRARMQKQMYKVHKPHLDSEYIAKIQYVKTVDTEGAPDWEMCYSPGPRARAHFNFFRRTAVESLPDSVPEEIKRSRVPRGSKVKPQELCAELSPAAAALRDRGVSPTAAEELAKAHEDTPGLIDVLEWGDHLINQARPGTFRNPAGFYIYLVREGIKPPQGFETTRLQLARQAAQMEEQERWHQQFMAEQAYTEYLERETDKYIQENITASELASLKGAKKKEVRGQFKHVIPRELDVLTERAVRTDIRRILHLKDFETFSRELVTA
ncbi:MAG TPA: hypothetical protein VF283_17410 [Bryobacteraceae bacterium]